MAILTSSMTNSTLPPVALTSLLVATGLIVLPHAANIPIPLFSFFVVLLAWRLLAIWTQLALPNKWVLLLLSALAILSIIYQFRGIVGREAGTNMLVVSLALKLMETRTKRDFYLLAFISFFVASTQFLYFDSIFMAVYILVISCSLLASLIYLNCKHLNIVLAYKLAVKLVLQAMPLMIIIFAVFPRIETPRWLLQLDDKNMLSGLSSTLEPGSISSLGKSDKLAFRVKFKGKIPPPEHRYWRGPVFNYTDGKRWSQALRVNKNISKTKPTRPKFWGDQYTYNITLEPQKFNWVYALDLPAAFSKRLDQRIDYQLLSKNNKPKRNTYSITSYSKYKTLNNELELPDNLQLPKQPSKRIRDFLKQLRGDNKQPEYLIDQLLKHFNKNEFYYTLNPPLYPNNPVETFLFEERKGFCSHYATSFVYLMRAANIPARVVGGYQGGEYNEIGGFLEIRQAQAHAWTEVWLQNKGWVRVDPTAAVAPERISQGINISSQLSSGEVSYMPANIAISGLSKWLQNVRFLGNSLNYSWQQWVIHYSSNSRKRFLSQLGIDDVKKLALWLSLLIAVVLGILALLILPRKVRHFDKVVQVYNRFCSTLAKSGIQKRPGEGPLDFAARINNIFPTTANEVEQITDLYIKLRYRNISSKDDLICLKQRVAQFKIIE